MYIIKLLHSLESGFRILLILLPSEERTKIRHTRELVCIKKALQAVNQILLLLTITLLTEAFMWSLTQLKLQRI